MSEIEPYDSNEYGFNERFAIFVEIGSQAAMLGNDNTNGWLHKNKEHSGGDHLFVVTGEESGFYIWRSLADRTYGDGAFDRIFTQLQIHGMHYRYEDEMSDFDRGHFEDWIDGQVDKEFVDVTTIYDSHDLLVKFAEMNEDGEIPLTPPPTIEGIIGQLSLWEEEE